MIRLTVQTLEHPADSFDESPESWADTRVEWFKVMPLSAREFIQAQGVESTVSHKAECPWFAGANTTMRLVSDDRTFNVASVVNRYEQNRTLDWMLTEING